MLYWAALFDTIHIDLMNKVLKEMEAYPEGPVKIENWKSPCHAAALVGNPKKLKDLMSEVNTRYTIGTDNNAGGRSNSHDNTSITAYFE